MLTRILLQDPSPERLDHLTRALEGPGTVVARAEAAEDVWRQIVDGVVDFVVVDRDFLGPDPAERVASLREHPEQPDVIVLVHNEDPNDRANLLAAGCFAVLYADLDAGLLEETLRAVMVRRQAERRRAIHPDVDFGRNRLTDFAATSPAMSRLIATARRVARTDSTLLILGDTGVGKEWLARAIHAEGPRGRGPFVAVNCGALPESLLESELFGHERGAFSGAIRSHRGHFELAHGGTLFLDEIAEMPTHLQVKLLRALQERCIQPVGGEKNLPVDVRIMAATNRDPAAEIAKGRLRSDLYYRLGVVALTLPPLRERREDIPALARAYLDRFRIRIGRDVRGFEPEAMDAMTRYAWPGNVRELINVVERAVILSSGMRVTLSDLPDEVSRGASPTAAAPPPAAVPAALIPFDPAPLARYADAREAALASFERAYLEQILRLSGGRIGEAAFRAGIDPRTLHAKMKQHGIRKEAFKVGTSRSLAAGAGT